MFIHRLYCSFCTTMAYAFWYLFVFSYSPLNVLYSEIVQYESFKFRQKFVFCYPLRMFIKLLFACMFFSGCCNKLCEEWWHQNSERYWAVLQYPNRWNAYECCWLNLGIRQDVCEISGIAWPLWLFHVGIGFSFSSFLTASVVIKGVVERVFNGRWSRLLCAGLGLSCKRFIKHTMYLRM